MLTRWLVALWLLLPTLADAGNFRCGANVIIGGESSAQVLNLCGEPWRTWQDGFLEEEYGWRDQGMIILEPQATFPYPGQSGSFHRYKRIIPVYRWEYRPGAGRFLKILTFHGDRLIGISDGPRQ